MRHATRVALFGVLVVVIFALGLAGEYYISLHAIAVSNQHWCDTLNLITQHRIAPPAHPAKDPSRQGQYLLYRNFVHLKHQFRCGN